MSEEGRNAMLRCVEILNNIAKQKRLCAGNPEAPPDYAETLLGDADVIEQSAREMERAWFSTVQLMDTEETVCMECGQVKLHQNHWAPFGWHDFEPSHYKTHGEWFYHTNSGKEEN